MSILIYYIVNQIIKKHIKQLQLSDRQSSFIFYPIHHGKGRILEASLAGLATPRQSAYFSTQSSKIMTKIRQESKKVYQTKIASTAAQTHKEVMKNADASTSARIAAASMSLALVGDIGKHSQSKRNYKQNLAEMTPGICEILLTGGKVKKLKL